MLINILTLVKNISLDIFMTFAPAINYVFQALKFKKTKSSKGFSSYLCLVTILAHTISFPKVFPLHYDIYT